MESPACKFQWRALILVALLFCLHVKVEGQQNRPFGKESDTVTIEAVQNPFLHKFGYSGSRVGPLYLFRSSAKNAQIVKEGFKNAPIMRTVGMALGDEFPNLRDDLVGQRKKLKSDSYRIRTPFVTSFRQTLKAMAKNENWKFDMDNNKKEKQDPFMRPSKVWANSVRGNIQKYASQMRTTTGQPNFRIDIRTPVKKV